MILEGDYFLLDRWWAASLVEHLMEAGLCVMCHGEPMPLQDDPVHHFLQLTASKSKNYGHEVSALWET